MSSILFTLIFGAVVFLGIHITDYVNRSLMFVKLGSYVLLVCCLMPFVSLPNLATSNLSVLKTSAAMIVTITSFGFSIIVPSLRIYLNGDIRKLKKTILIGSLIPLVCYIIWDMVIMGVVPLQGANGLGNILHSSQSTSLLVANLTATTNHHAVTLFVKLFTSICVLTSFLGVSLCLSDFLADGFGLEKVGFNRIIIHAAAFLPPLLVVLINPNAFIRALEYAGIYCIVLLVLMPAWMTLRGRRVYSSTAFRVPGGSWLLYLLIGFAALSIVYGLVC